MGKRGPRKAPAIVKIARGTARADRDGDPVLAPKVSAIADCPSPPDGLGEDGRDYWIIQMPLMIQAAYFSSLDVKAFERCCRAVDEVAKCDRILLEEGEYSVSGDSGYISQHPAVNQRFKWLEIIRRYEDAFWLNPTARSGKQIAGGRGRQGVARRNRA